MRFSDALAAINWAETVISIFEGGKSANAFIRSFGGGIHKEYAILDAYQIRMESERACAVGYPCPYQRARCLFQEYLPDPLIYFPEPSKSEKKRRDDCRAEFERRLREKNYLE